MWNLLQDKSCKQTYESRQETWFHFRQTQIVLCWQLICWRVILISKVS